VNDRITGIIDHALLHPTLTDDQLREGCEVGKRLRVASICIKPYAVSMAAGLLAGSDVAVCTVIGFPHGSPATKTKVMEVAQVCQDGATEVDMVVNVGKVLSSDWAFVEDDIRAVVEAAHEHGAIAKVIFENEFLPTDDLKIELCRISSKVGADFVKTSTGFGFISRDGGGFSTVGATDSDLRLMRANSSPRVGVKASGGIRTYADAVRVVNLGATRIGTSSTEAIAMGEQSHPTAAISDQGY
jgi:deoxyribose-phosphate aldolase